MKTIKFLVLLFFSLCLSQSVSAQQTTQKEKNVSRFMWHFDSHFSTLDKALRYGSYGLAIDKFYNQHVYVGVGLRNQIEALKTQGVKNNYRTTLFTAEGGYQWSDKDGDLNDVRFVWGLPLNKHSFNYRSYELGYYGTMLQKFSGVTFGGGVRFFDSVNKNYKDKVGVFLSVGYTFAINIPKVSSKKK